MAQWWVARCSSCPFRVFSTTLQSSSLHEFNLSGLWMLEATCGLRGWLWNAVGKRRFSGRCASCQVLPGEGRPDRAALVRFGSADEAKWIVERASLASWRIDAHWNTQFMASFGSNSLSIRYQKKNFGVDSVEPLESARNWPICGARSVEKPWVCLVPSVWLGRDCQRSAEIGSVAIAQIVLESWCGWWCFPECVARVPVSLWGSGGWGCVRSTLPSRSQPFATVRNRSCEDRMAVPMGSSAGGIIFGGFRRLVASFRVAGVALRDIQQRSVTCRKSLCVAGAILLRRFAKMRGRFRGRRSTFDVSIVIFRGRHSTLDVSCCVFFVNRILAGLRQVATRCIFRGSRGILCDVLKIDGSLARNIDFEVANFHVLRKTHRKTSILKLQSVKIGGSLARNARFGASTCLVSRHWFYGGFAVSMGEAAKHVSSACFKVWKLEDVWHEMLVVVLPCVSSRVSGFPVVSPCLWGKPQNLSFSKVSTQVVMSFCVPRLRGRRGTLWHVAGVALCDIPTCLITCRTCKNWRKSRTKCWFFLYPHILSRVSGFPVASPCLWGKLQNISFWRFPSRLSCRFAWQAWHFVTFQPVC